MECTVEADPKPVAQLRARWLTDSWEVNLTQALIEIKMLPKEADAFSALINNQALMVLMIFTITLRENNCIINTIK
jgi:hypothetical protein